MNKGAEETRGSGVVFDPIKAIVDAYQVASTTPDKRRGAILAGGRLGGEILSNLPFGQTVAGAYDEFGGGFLGGMVENATGEKISRKQLFGRADPTRYGSGLLVSKALKDPLYSVLPAYGGSQIKKTVEGIKAVKEGGSFDKGGNLQFEANQSPIKTILFGKYATQEAKDYFNKADIKTAEQNKIIPIYIEAQKLKEAGKEQEALDLVNSLTDEQYATYKELKTKDKKKATSELKKQILPIYQKAQKLKESGMEQEALDLVNSLSDDEYRVYKLLKDQLTK
jgi:hypothetical protein